MMIIIVCYYSQIIFLIFLASILCDKALEISHKAFIDKLHNIWKKVDATRAKYRAKMELQWNKTHNVTLYVISYHFIV